MENVEEFRAAGVPIGQQGNTIKELEGQTLRALGKAGCARLLQGFQWTAASVPCELWRPHIPGGPAARPVLPMIFLWVARGNGRKPNRLAQAHAMGTGNSWHVSAVIGLPWRDNGGGVAIDWSQSGYPQNLSPSLIPRTDQNKARADGLCVPWPTTARWPRCARE